MRATTRASGWVSAIASSHRAEASSLYLFGYYTGSSVIGAVAGVPFARSGWEGTLRLALATVLAALVIDGGLWRMSTRRQASAVGR